jgi:hypothetical protein
MVNHTVFIITNYALEIFQPGILPIIRNTRLTYYTHIDLSYMIAAKPLRTSSLYP